MFKSTRWRSEKNKFKEIFKLKFHATQVPQLSVDGLMISLVPGDLGKPTLRLEKATIRDGTCCWENSVYETVKFIREPKTGKITEKIYHFIVSTGSLKGSLVGEVSIDFANYAEATKASSMALPLKNSNSDAVLHVTIQRMQGNIDQREVNENEHAYVKPQEKVLKTQLSNSDTDGSIRSTSTEDRPSPRITTQISDGLLRASSGSDITMSSSESSSGLNTPRGVGLKSNPTYQDPTSFLSSLSHASMPQNPMPQSSQWEWSAGSAPEFSTDDSTSSSADTHQGEKSRQGSDNEKLKSDLFILSRQADMSELELQTLRKQVVKERKRGQDLSREVVCLKEERDTLKTECETLKAFQKRMEDAKLRNRTQFESGDPLVLLEEIRQELSYEKDLNANLRLQLQKTQESNAELLLAVQDLDEMLEQKDREISVLPDRSRSEIDQGLHETRSKQENIEDEEQKALEDLVKGHTDAKEAYMLEQKVIDLYGEIEIYRRDKDELEAQMEQLALDYEIMKQENHDMSYKLEQSMLQEQLKIQYECSSSFATMSELEIQIENLESDLKSQSKELSDSLATIKELETRVRGLEEELEIQAQGFEADLETITRSKIEQEQRAIKVEEALRTTRWKNASTAEKLQEEFRRLSTQMASTFDANEKLASKALREADELRLQKLQLHEMLQKATDDLESARDHYEARVSELSVQIDLNVNQIEALLNEIEEKSKQLQEIVMLKDEIKKLRAENTENEKLRAEMKQTITLMEVEGENYLDELNRMRTEKDERETILGNLLLDLESLKAQYDELRGSFLEDELEIDKLKKQVSNLKDDLAKKDDALTSIEKKLKESHGRATISDGTRVTSRTNKPVPAPRGSKEILNLREKIKELEGQIKLKETALEASTNSFVDKEKEFQSKIEELESRLEEINQDSSLLIESELKKVTKDAREQNATEMSLVNRNQRDDETALLKDRNESMAAELKEMQERYSEISLRFAEVEGERQKLVMMVRNLKNNAKKG